MPTFSYKARDNQGGLVTGTLDGNDKAAVEERLDRMSLIPITISAAKEKTQLSFAKLNTFFEKISDQDIIIFSRQLATLFGAGIPLTKALSTLERQMTNPKFTDIIKGIRVEVEGGSTFAAAIGRHPKVFGDLYSGMVEAGEAGGILDDVLDRVAFMLEKSSENRAKVKSATLYPKIVVGAIGAAVVFLLWFVVPKFAQLYGSFNVPLPLPTRMLIGLSTVVLSYWYIGIALIAALIVAVKFYRSTEKGRYNWDRLTLKVPIFGPLMVKSIMARFARVLGSLYKSGLPILQSLDIVSRTVDNAVIAKSIKTIEDDVREGRGLTEPMTESDLFPPMVIQMVGVGEETGGLDEMLEKVAVYYDQEVEATIRNLTTTMEPILLAFIFGMVLFLALAIFLPMWDLASLAR